jgi:hypothetical protein
MDTLTGSLAMWSAHRAVHYVVALVLLRAAPLQAQGLGTDINAHFALLARLPELTKPAALGGAVLLAGQRVSFRLGASGPRAWEPGELDRLVQAFRS